MILSTILSLINPLGSIAEKIVAAKTRAADSATALARIEAEVEVSQLEARQAVIIAEQGSLLTRWIRPAFALPFILYNFKVIVWDKMLGWGVTDDLSSSFWQLQMVIFGAYFLTRGFEKRR